MMPFGFGHRADAVYEIESAFEIGKQESLLDVMAVDHFPIGKLRRQLFQSLAFEGRHAAPARHAMLIGKIAHPRSTHTSMFRTSTGYVFSGFNCSCNLG